LKKQIEQGAYRGWDDPQLPTVKALRRRGFIAEALRQFILKLGVNESDVSVSLENLYAENKKLVDPVANRYFFVEDPAMMNLLNAPVKTARAPLHPSKPLSLRRIRVGSEVCISAKDLNFLSGDTIRLKDLYNVRIVSKEPLEAEYVGDDIVRGLKIIHWAPPDGPLVEVLKPDGIDRGIGEPGIETQLGKVVQFERYGFARVDEVHHGRQRMRIICYFTHK
jgi:glutamyl-tRNA synthetase